MLETILLGVVIALAVIIFIVIIVSAIKDIKRYRKNKNNKDVSNVDNKDSNQLISNKQINSQIKETINEEFDKEIKKEEKQIKAVLPQGESIQFGSNGELPCGEYILESNDGSEKFNVRVGRYVKEYSNGDKLILTENHKVTAVSTTIIIR